MIHISNDNIVIRHKCGETVDNRPLYYNGYDAAAFATSYASSIKCIADELTDHIKLKCVIAVIQQYLKTLQQLTSKFRIVSTYFQYVPNDVSCLSKSISGVDPGIDVIVEIKLIFKHKLITLQSNVSDILLFIHNHIKSDEFSHKINVEEQHIFNDINIPNNVNTCDDLISLINL